MTNAFGTALGIDISTRKIALAGISLQGDLHTHNILLPREQRGAVRLATARAQLMRSLNAERWADTYVAVIEVAWPGFVLLSMTAIVMEAVQTTFPGAVVMEVSASTWKKETIGHGRATKDEYITFAQAQGLEGRDEDSAAATCLAVCAWERWHRTIGHAA